MGKSRSKLNIWLLAGLGNRLRTIDAAIAFCNKSGHRLEIIWPQTDEMVASFDDLFQHVPDFRVIRKPISAEILDRMVRNTKLHRFIPSYKRLMPYDSVKLDEEIRDTESFEELEEVLQKGSAFLRTCHPITEAKKHYDWVKPNNRIDREASVYDRVFSLNCRVVGVHIRRTDHHWAKEQSPDELFFKYMELELARSPRIRFFLFTDDEGTCDRFVTHFGEAVIVRPKLYGRDSVAATQDALIDWLLLSKCGVIFHSYWSSFSYTASLRFGHQLLEISLKNESRLAGIYHV